MARDYVQFQLRFLECHDLRGPEDALPAALALPKYGFLPAEGARTERHAVQDIAALVATHTHSWPPGPMGTWQVAFPVLPAWTQPLICSFSCNDSKATVTFFTCSTLINREEAEEIEPFAQRLLSLGLDLYPTVKPALGWIDDSSVNMTALADIKKRRVPTISWANFFGPSYVAQYGREFLLAIPGYRTQELADGGVFHQLTPHFVEEDARSTRSLRQAVKDHFARAGHRVRCQAPYLSDRLLSQEKPPSTPIRLSKATQGTLEEAPPTEVQGYGTLDQFKAGLAELLRATLVLQNGKRVKVVYLLWESMTGDQRMHALLALRRVAESELRQHPKTPVHFEFNQLPDDLRAELDRLATRYPSLSYAEVDMEPH